MNNRIVKFRGLSLNGDWYFGNLAVIKGKHSGVPNEGSYISNSVGMPFAYPVRPETVGQFTGLLDKEGKEIYEGNTIRYRRPYRSTQTHYGDNIPNGSYTEPMEPEIETIEVDVVFKDGCFGVIEERGSNFIPLMWLDQQYDEQSIKEAIAIDGSDEFWDVPEEGELQYLLDTYNLKDLQELIEYVSGIEVIGNIYQHAHLLSELK